MIERLKQLRNLVEGGTSVTSFEDIFFGESIEDDFIVRADGNVSAGFVLSYPDKESNTVDQIRTIQTEFEKLLKGLPIGTVAHFQSIYYNEEKSLQATTEINAVGLITRKIIDHLGAKPVQKQTSFLYICFNLTGEPVRNPFATWFADYDRLAKAFLMKNPLAKVDSHKRKANTIIQTFLTQLNSPAFKGFQIKRLNTVDIIYARLRYFNLKFSRNPRAIEGDFSNLGNKILVGGKILKTVTLRTTGTQVFYNKPNDRGIATYMASPLGQYLDCEHIVNTAIMIVDTDKELKGIDKYQAIRQSILTDRKRNALIAGDLQAFTTEIRQSGQSLVSLNQNVMTWGDSDEDVNFNVDKVLSAYQIMNGSVPMIEAFNAGTAYFTFAPGMALEMTRPVTISLEDAILHLDFTKSTITEQKGVVVCNREGAPVLLDLWPPESVLPNKNRIVIGPSGSGKSFFMNSILSQEMETGVEVIIIDVGGSYKNLFTIKNGVYYDYTEDTPLSFNPFLVPKDSNGKWVLTEDKKTFLLALIEVIWKGHGNELKKEEQSVLFDLFTRYYEMVNTRNDGIIPRLDKFIDFVQDQEEKAKSTIERKKAKGEKLTDEDLNFQYFDVNSFKLVFRKFNTGSYSKLLNSDTNQDISFHQLVAFDLNGVKENDTLYPIVGLIIINLIIDKLNDDSKRHILKEVVIDEAWSMLQGSMGEAINSMFRTIRKQGGAVTIVTQGIAELKGSGTLGEAIKANAATVVVLDHSSNRSQLPGIQSFFGFTNHNVEQISSIRSVEGISREFFIKRADLAQIFWLDVGPHNLAAFSTSPSVKAKIHDLKKSGGVEYAINQFVEDQNKEIGL